MAELLNIWTKPAKGEQMVSHESIECIKGEGLQGCVGGKANHRQVTILSLAAWNEAQQEIGEQMDPIYRRMVEHFRIILDLGIHCNILEAYTIGS